MRPYRPMKLAPFLVGVLPLPVWYWLWKRDLERQREEAREAARKQWKAEQRASYAELDEMMRKIGLPAITDDPYWDEWLR